MDISIPFSATLNSAYCICSQMSSPMSHQIPPYFFYSNEYKFYCHPWPIMARLHFHLFSPLSLFTLLVFISAAFTINSVFHHKKTSKWMATSSSCSCSGRARSAHTLNHRWISKRSRISNPYVHTVSFFFDAESWRMVHIRECRDTLTKYYCHE